MSRVEEVAELYLADMRIKDIAARTGLAANTVKAYTLKARKAGLIPPVADIAAARHCTHCGAPRSRWSK